MDVELNDIRNISQLVKRKHNYDFTNYAISSFKRRITRILELHKIDIPTLVNKLENDTSFIDEFLVEVTVNVTEMFRDPSFWVSIRESIIPGILLNNKEFKIWHAGCSSGEEVYSMSILLHELGIADRVQLYASDIDHVILDKAQKGIFHLKNMELNEKNYIRFGGQKQFDSYYSVRDNKAYMDNSLVKNVKYIKHDLVKDMSPSKFDLILCRNVMIYFNQTLQNEVLNKFHGSLHRYGYLAIGSKESLIWCDISNKFIVVNNEEKVYKKIRE